MSIGVTMLPTRNYMKGMLVGSLAFLGLSFCSPPAPALELKNIIRQDQAKCLADNMYFEARNQSVLSQIAVSQVVMNRVQSPDYPNTVCGVVYEAQLSTWYKEKMDKLHHLRDVVGNNANFQNPEKFLFTRLIEKSENKR